MHIVTACACNTDSRRERGHCQLSLNELLDMDLLGLDIWGGSIHNDQMFK